MTFRDKKTVNITIIYQPDILNFSVGISNNPMSSDKLHRAVWIIGNSYSVCEEAQPLWRLTSTLYVNTPDLNPDPLEFF